MTLNATLERKRSGEIDMNRNWREMKLRSNYHKKNPVSSKKIRLCWITEGVERKIQVSCKAWFLTEFASIWNVGQGGESVTVYRHYAETQGYTLCGGFSPPSYISYMGNKSNLTSHRPYGQSSTFMYIFHLFSIDLQLSRSFNSPTLHCYRKGGWGLEVRCKEEKDRSASRTQVW